MSTENLQGLAQGGSSGGQGGFFKSGSSGGLKGLGARGKSVTNLSDIGASMNNSLSMNDLSAYGALKEHVQIEPAQPLVWGVGGDVAGGEALEYEIKLVKEELRSQIGLGDDPVEENYDYPLGSRRLFTNSPNGRLSKRRGSRSERGRDSGPLEAYERHQHVYVGHALKELSGVEDKAWEIRNSREEAPFMRFKRAEHVYEFDLQVEGPMVADASDLNADEW